MSKKPREYTEKLLEMIEEGLLDKDNVIMACVKYMSEDDVKDMMESNEFIDNEEDEECEACQGKGYLEVTHKDSCEYIEACDSCDYFGIIGNNEELNEKARDKARQDGVKMTKKGKVK